MSYMGYGNQLSGMLTGGLASGNSDPYYGLRNAYEQQERERVMMGLYNKYIASANSAATAPQESDQNLLLLLED